MGEGVGTVAMTYEISGVAGLAVRVGRALETWGARAARPIERAEPRQQSYDAAIEARRSALTGVHHVMR